MELNKLFFPAPSHSAEILRANMDGVVWIPRHSKEERNLKVRKETIQQFSKQFGKSQKPTKLLSQFQEGDGQCPEEEGLEDSVMGSSRKRLDCSGSVIFPEFSKADEDPLKNNATRMSNYLSPSFSKVNSFTQQAKTKQFYSASAANSPVAAYSGVNTPLSTGNHSFTRSQQLFMSQAYLQSRSISNSSSNNSPFGKVSLSGEERTRLPEEESDSNKSNMFCNDGLPHNKAKININDKDNQNLQISLQQQDIKIVKHNLQQNINEKNEELPAEFNSETHIVGRLTLGPDLQSKHIVLYFHSNAEDIITSEQLVGHISRSLSMPVLAVEYPGYSHYTGECDAQRIENDSLKVFDFLTREANVNNQNILVIGRSMGTGAATYLASKRKIGALVLISPFTSIKDLIRDRAGSFAASLVADRFNNSQRIQNVTCPTFITHGQKDNLIPQNHAQILYQNCAGPCELILPKDMAHNKFDFSRDLTDPLLDFLIKNHFHSSFIDLKHPPIKFPLKIILPPQKIRTPSKQSTQDIIMESAVKNTYC